MANLRDLLDKTVSRYGNLNAFTLKTGIGEYVDISFAGFYADVNCFATAMIRDGMAGENIAVIGKNSYNWFLVHAASEITASVSILLDKELKYDEFESCLIRSGATYIFYDKKEKPMIDRAISDGKTALKGAFALYECDEANVEDMLERGKNFIDDGGGLSVTDIKINDDALGLLLFTSGTTSQSKAVMLSQNNIVQNIYAMLDAERDAFHSEMTNLALVPYHHSFGFVGQWVILAIGSRTVYCDGLKYIQKNMQEYGVSIFIGVPLIVETMYKRVLKVAESQGALKRLQVVSKIGRALNKVHIDIRRQVFKGVLEALGGKMELCIIGGAPADPAIIQGFNDLGILTIQGYGLTETSPVLTCERKNVMKSGSVGKPLPNVELKIIDKDENGIGEVIVRGPNVMLGYYNDEEKTKEVLTDDGWFHTGDLGYVDRDGFLFLTGRKKNVIVLKNGKNVFPEEIEQLLLPLPYMKECIVLGIPNHGDEKDLVVTLKFVYDPAETGDMTYEQIYEMLKNDVEKINDTMPSYKRVKRILLTDEELVKTTTAKVKRHEEYKKIVEEMAKGEAK